MQMTVESLIVALRGAAAALEQYDLHFEDGEGEEPVSALTRRPKIDPFPAEDPKEPAERSIEAATEPSPTSQPDPEPPAPWDAEPAEAPPPRVEQVTAQDIVALYQQVAQAGKKVDMLKLLSGLGVEKVGELDDAGRAKLYTQIKAEAGL